jgi:hypothetical protein
MLINTYVLKVYKSKKSRPQNETDDEWVPGKVNYLLLLKECVVVMAIGVNINLPIYSKLLYQ